MRTFKKKLIVFLCAGLLLAILSPVSFAARTLSYNYVKGSLCIYPDADYDQSFMGVELQGSYLITPEIFALGGLQYLTDDFDLTAIHAGAAYRYGLDNKTDIYGGLTIEHQDYDGVFDDTALGLRGGIRHILNADWELGGQLRIVTGDLDYVGMRGTARYFIDEDLSLVGEVDVYDGDLGLLGGITYNF